MAYRKVDQPTSHQADTHTLVSAALIHGKILPNRQDSDDELVTKDTPNKPRNEKQGDCRLLVNINFYASSNRQRKEWGEIAGVFLAMKHEGLPLKSDMI